MPQEYCFDVIYLRTRHEVKVVCDAGDDQFFYNTQNGYKPVIIPDMLNAFRIAFEDYLKD